MKHERFSRLTKKFIASAMLAVALISSGNSFAESPLIEDESAILVDRSSECKTAVDTINVGFSICPENLIVYFIDAVGSQRLLNYSILEAFGWASKFEMTESVANDFFGTIQSNIFWIANVILGLTLFFTSIYLIIVMRGKKFKAMKKERSAKLLVNTIYAWTHISFNTVIMTIYLAYAVLVSGLILSIYFAAAKESGSEDIKLSENESKPATKAFSTNLMATSMAFLDTRTALFDHRLVKFSDMSLSEALAEYSEANQLQWSSIKISRRNFDMTSDFGNMFNKYEFVSKIDVGYVPNKNNALLGNKLTESVSVYLSNNDVFKDIEGSLEGDSINDGTILSALSEASAAASQINVSVILNEFTMAIKADLKSNSYADSNPYDGVTQKIYALAESTGSPVASAIKENVQNPVDRVALTTSTYKKLSDSAMGNNVALTVKDWVAFSDKIVMMMKLAKCSKDYRLYDSARANLSKLNYGASVQQNIQNNAFSWNSCIVVTADKIELIGFDAEAQPDRLLDIEQTIEAGTLAIERTAQAIRTAYQHAADKELNLASNEGDSSIQKSDKQLTIEALKAGVMGAGLRIGDAQTALTERMKAREAFTAENMFIYGGGASENSPYIISDRIFPKSTANDFTESQKNIFDKYSDSYSGYTYTKFDKADFTDLASVNSAAVTEQNDIMASIEAMLFDFKPLQLAMGMSTSESFIASVKKCNASDNCKAGSIRLTTFLSMIGYSGLKAAVTIIVMSEVTDTLKGFVDNLGDTVEAGSSNSKIGKMVSGGLKMVGVLSKSVLMMVSAGLNALKALAYPMIPVCLLLAVFIPLVFAFIAIFFGLRFIGYFIYISLIDPFVLMFTYWREDFSPVRHSLKLFANFNRLVFATFFFVVILIIELLMPFGHLLLMLAATLATSTIGVLMFIIVSAVMMTFIMKWIVTSHGEWTNKSVVAIGGDESEFGMTHFEIGVVTAKLSQMTYGAKNAIASNTNKAINKFKENRKAKQEPTPEPIKFKDVKDEKQS